MDCQESQKDEHWQGEGKQKCQSAQDREPKQISFVERPFSGRSFLGAQSAFFSNAILVFFAIFLTEAGKQEKKRQT